MLCNCDQHLPKETMNELNSSIQSVDSLKGMVIVLTALDHTLDYFHRDYFYFDPTDIDQTNFIIVLRFLLAGTSAFFDKPNL